MLDLSEKASDHIGTLAKTTISRDGTAADALVYDTAIVFDIENEEDARVVDNILRGTLAYFEAYKDNEEPGKISRSPKEITGNLAIIDADDGVTVVNAMTEIFSLEVSKGRKAIAFTVKARYRGLDSAAAAHFARHLNRRLTFQWEVPPDLQATLPFAVPAASNAVQVVTAYDESSDTFVFGVQTGIDGDRVMLDDFGSTFEVAKDQVTSKTIFAPEHGASGPPLAEVLAPTVDEIRAANGTPSWQYIVLAVAEIRGAEIGLESSVYRITREEIARAAEMAIEAAA